VVSTVKVKKKLESLNSLNFTKLVAVGL
jgi:hypothetical protein